MSEHVVCWNCERIIEPGTFGSACPACDDAAHEETERLRQALSASEARVAEVERERDKARATLETWQVQAAEARMKRDLALARVKELEVGLREDVKILDYLSFLAGFLEDRIENEEAQARVQCVIHDLRAHALRAKDVRALLTPPPSTGSGTGGHHG